METKKANHSQNLSTISKVALFLATRQIRRSSPWTNILIIFIMTLTFLNLVIVSGILVGLIQGAVEAVQTHYLGDVFISALKQRPYIEQTPVIIKTAENLPGVEAVSARYIEAGIIETNYQVSRKPIELDETVGTSFAGIDPIKEDRITNLSKKVVKGEYLERDDYDEVLLGAMLLKQYLDFESPNFPVLANVDVGSKIRIKIGDVTREVRVKGIVRSKVDELDRRVFFVDSQLRTFINRFDYNVDEIVVKANKNVNPLSIKNALITNGLGKYAKIQTAEEAEPKFIKDMKATFALLGNMISSIGLVVAAITIFIVIFINAITRKKFIGILKGIGINSHSIEIAYIFQSLFYAVIGSVIGTIIVFGLLKPYFQAHPINFPFSDGILVATFEDTSIRILILLIATFIAGYIPARMVVRQNTLDAILGR